jgi:hypothetical protein
VVAWDPLVGSALAFLILIYVLSLRERSEVSVNCAVYAFFSLVAGVAAAILLNATEFGYSPRGDILGRVIFASFALGIAGSTAMSFSYPFATARPGRLALFLYPVAVIFAALTLFTPFVVSGAEEQRIEGQPVATLHFAVGAWPFSIYAAACHALIVRNSVRAWRSAKSKVHKRRAQALFAGYLLPTVLTVVLAALLTLVTPLALALGIPIDFQAPFTSIFFVVPLLGVGYALARYRLFDMQLFLREGVVTIFAFFLGGYVVVLLMAALIFVVPGAPLALVLVGGVGLFALVGAGYPMFRDVSAWVIDKIAPKQRWVEFQPVEAYLVMKDSGVLVAHTAREGSAKGPDEDIVGSMLSAIQEFVRSSFGTAEPLREMNLGKTRMLIEYGSLLYIAMVYDGRVSDAVREDIARGLKEMESRHGEVLKDWKGRESAIDPIRVELRKVMEETSLARTPMPDVKEHLRSAPMFGVKGEDPGAGPDGKG